MSTDHHTPITTNAAANAAIVNAPLAELDNAINVEHETDGTHSAGIIDTTELADGAVTTGKLDADAVDGTKLADDAVDSEHIAAGAIDNEHFAAGAITAQSKFALADAANANGELIRYDEYNGHQHAVYTLLYADNTQSAAQDTPAAGLPSYVRSDDNSNLITFVSVAFYKRADVDGLRLCGKKANTSATLTGTITFACGAASTTESVATGIGATDFELSLDISALADNAVHEIAVQLHYGAGAGGATGVITVTDVTIWGANSGSSPT